MMEKTVRKIAICGYNSDIANYYVEKYEENVEYVFLGRNEDADIQLDLSSNSISGNLNRLEECDALLDFTAVFGVNDDEQLLDLIQVNVLGKVFLAQIVKKYHIKKYIMLSSISAIYEKEDNYFNYYSLSKKSADEFVELYCRLNNIKLCILRPSGIFGGKNFQKHQRLLYDLIEKVKNNENIILYGSNDATRNYISIDTIVKIIHNVIDKDIEGVYSVVNQKNEKLTEIINSLKQAIGSNSEIKFEKSKDDINSVAFDFLSDIFALAEVSEPIDFIHEYKKTCM